MDQVDVKVTTQTNKSKKGSSRKRICWCCRILIAFFSIFFFSLTILFVSSIPTCAFGFTLGIISLVDLGCTLRKNKDRRHAHRKRNLYLIFAYAFVLFTLLCLNLFILFSMFISPNNDLQVYGLNSISSSTATIWARSTNYQKMEVQYALIDDTHWLKTQKMAFNSSKDHIARTVATQLSPFMQYKYKVVLYSENEGNGDQVGEGTFTTLPQAGDKKNYRFASTSCVMKGLYWGYDLYGFERLQEQNPLFTLFIGDLIYTDVPLLFVGLGSRIKNYYAKYRETYVDPYFQSYSHEIPTFFMLDDHEIINDYAGLNSTKVFQSAFAAWMHYAGEGNPKPYGYPYGDDRNLRFHYHFTAGDASFFVFDTRYFRHDGTKVLLGKQQMLDYKNWLLQINSTSTFKFLVSPTPWTLNYRNGWSKFIEEREEILDFIKDNYVSGCIFLSGDAHRAHVFELRPGLIEISASPLGATSPFFNVFREGIDKVVYEQNHNRWSPASQYSIIEVMTTGPDPHINALIYGGIGSTLYSNLTIYANNSFLLNSVLPQGTKEEL